MFDQLNVQPQPYIIPKAWYTSWRKDPIPPSKRPDDQIYNMFCEHGNRFEVDPKSQIPISSESLAVLHSVFGDFKTLKSDSDVCAICEVERAGDVQALKVWEDQVKAERAIGKAIKGSSATLVFGMDFFAIPGSFYNAWQTWTRNPLPQGGKVELDMGLCEHGGLEWDPMMEWPKWVDEKGWKEVKKWYGQDLPEVIIKFGAHSLPGKKTSVIEVTPPACDICCKAK